MKNCNACGQTLQSHSPGEGLLQVSCNTCEKQNIPYESPVLPIAEAKLVSLYNSCEECHGTGWKKNECPDCENRGEDGHGIPCMECGGEGGWTEHCDDLATCTKGREG